MRWEDKAVKFTADGSGDEDCVGGGGIYSESLRILFGKNKARRDARRASVSGGLAN